LDPGDPRLGGRQRGADPDPDLRQLPHRIESAFGAIDEFVCKNSDFDWEA